MVADLRSAADLSQAFQHAAVAGRGALRTGALVRWIEREWGFFRKRKIQPHHDQQLRQPERLRERIVEKQLFESHCYHLATGIP